MPPHPTQPPHPPPREIKNIIFAWLHINNALTPPPQHLDHYYPQQLKSMPPFHQILLTICSPASLTV